MNAGSRLCSCFALLAALAGACTTEDAPPRSADPPQPDPAVGADVAWRTGAEMPTHRTEVAVAGVGEFVVVAGGFTEDGATSDAVEVYSVAADAWDSLPPLPEPRHHAALVAVSDRFYLIGGYRPDGAPSGEVWLLAETRWEAGPSLPEARGALAAALVGDEIHVVGGATGFGAGARLSDRHDIFDTTTGTWRQAPALPEARDHLAAASIGPRLYVVGGRKLSLTTNSSRLDVFDTEAGTWVRGPDMPTARGGLAAAQWRGRLVVAGGEEPRGTFPEVEFYDPREDGWNSGPPLPTPRHGLGAAGLRSEFLVVVGGGPSPGLAVSGATELLEVVD